MNRKLCILLCAAIILSVCATGADALQFTVSPQYDVNKYVKWPGGAIPIPPGVDPTNTSDSEMCWAATVSNVLMYTGWGFDRDSDGTVELYDDLYHDFLADFENVAGNGAQGYGHYVPDFWSSQLSAAGQTWQDYFHQEDDDDEILDRVEDWLDLDYGIYLSITNNSGTLGHAITAWGYETDDTSGDYTRIAVTDSDDWTSGLQWYNLALSSNRWYMTDYGTDVYIRRIDAYDKNPFSVPEPATLLLIGTGLVGLVGFRRKFRE